MRLERASKRKRVKQSEDVILFVVDGTRFAISAGAVDEIRNLDGLTPHSSGFMSKLAKVKFTLVREKKDREKVYFVVDASTHFRIPQSKAGRVMVMRQASVAVLVDSIDRMAQISTVVAMPTAFTGEERLWYRGLALVDGHVIPVVNPDAFLNKGEVAVLNAGNKPVAGSVAVKGAASA